MRYFYPLLIVSNTIIRLNQNVRISPDPRARTPMQTGGDTDPVLK